MVRKDLSGKIFGYLTVKRRTNKNGIGNHFWLCDCVCGNSAIVATGHLSSGGVKSCGCMRQAAVTAAHVKHGKHGSSIYRIWQGMFNRCRNDKVPEWEHYGGRGIEVCERWHDFNAFYADMGDNPKGMSINRIDNNGNYEPSNCEWATVEEQANNKSNTIYVDEEKRLTLAQYARQENIPYWKAYKQHKEGGYD